MWPGDPRFSAVTSGYNQRWVADPVYVQMCNTADDVVAAVGSAVRAGLRITIRSGGHCYEDFVYGNSGGVIIDLSPMKGVHFDRANGWHVVEAGATLLDLYVRLFKEHGVTIPGGSCSWVGVGGHVAGGGYGLLSRLHGLTADHLSGIEIVHVDANGVAHCDRLGPVTPGSAESLLLWGCKGGGGGNFGVITKFFFGDLPPAPREAWLVSEAWNWDDFDESSFAEFLENYGRYFVDHKGAGDPSAGLFSLLKLYCAPAAQLVLTTQLVGDSPEPLEEFRKAVHPAGIESQIATSPAGLGTHFSRPGLNSLPWLSVTQALGGSGNSVRAKHKSAYMIGNFTKSECRTIWRKLRHPAVDHIQGLLQVDSYGGQVNAVASGATPLPQRSSAMTLQYQTYWESQRDDDDNLAWIRDFYRSMYGDQGPLPDGRLDGCYVNHPDADLLNWQTLYYKDNYPKLQRVKGLWDPLNIFHHAQSVELPAVPD